MNEIVIVSGLPRSGTSMMMSMLEAGGLALVVDHERRADEDNPKGYFELEEVKRLRERPTVLEHAQGKAVKIISQLLHDLPSAHPYKILFMRRNLDEILSSQREMLKRRQTEATSHDDETIRALSIQHLNEIMDWLRAQPNISTLYINYNKVLTAPRDHAQRINQFLDGKRNVDAMVAVVDKQLYRNRSAS